MLQGLRFAYSAWPGSIPRVLGRKMASSRNQAQRNVRAKQDLQEEAHVLAHIPDVVAEDIAHRMRAVGLLRRDGHKRKQRDRPAKRGNPRHPSKPSHPARHADLVMAVPALLGQVWTMQLGRAGSATGSGAALRDFASPRSPKIKILALIWTAVWGHHQRDV